MHVYFIGIGGAGIGPLAVIAKQAGYYVSGSDKVASRHTYNLKKYGIEPIIGQHGSQIQATHKQHPIDLIISTSFLPRRYPDHPELVYAREQGIPVDERHVLLNRILDEKDLKLIAVAGTHGKTTTAAMIVWLMKKAGIPVSYSFGAETTFADMGHYDSLSEYFVYECDEYDRNFLHFSPYLSAISGISWDHHEIYPTEANYYDAFRQFLAQTSRRVIIWKSDAEILAVRNDDRVVTIPDDENSDDIELKGRFNRRDGLLAMVTVAALTDISEETLRAAINAFPGLERRMEKLAENIYTDYAHTPEKIIACLNVAKEIKMPNQKLVVVYEPLTNRRQHYIQHLYEHLFDTVDHLYWVPSYLAREDPAQHVLTPAELIKNMANSEKAVPAELNETLKTKISEHQQQGDLIVLISGGGGDSLDEWARKNILKA